MMAHALRILLVEGRSDEDFYNEICGKKGLNINVKVAPPKGLGGGFNNKEGVFNFLPTLLDQLADGRVERLAVVVDADYQSEHGLGYQRTLDRVAGIVGGYGFTPVRRQNIAGTLFKSADGFHDLGLWVMPNNRNDGMLEDWIKSGIAAAEHDLMKDAESATAGLEKPRFKPIHRTKADVATWLAWQAAPGRGLGSVINADLLDLQSAQYTQFAGWLSHVFA
ncbi:DUF3226 domain-containing protein [Burkholderia sp. GS2Y]|uniref:DUF3226 domain-containing protein n=1 Tax=Burkholderia theae TaxID=3143496 RepID=A0ABU9WLF1_9BURK